MIHVPIGTHATPRTIDLRRPDLTWDQVMSPALAPHKKSVGSPEKLVHSAGGNVPA